LARIWNLHTEVHVFPVARST